MIIITRNKKGESVFNCQSSKFTKAEMLIFLNKQHAEEHAKIGIQNSWVANFRIRQRIIKIEETIELIETQHE